MNQKYIMSRLFSMIFPKECPIPSLKNLCIFNYVQLQQVWLSTLSNFFLFSSETRLPVFCEPSAFLACLQKLLTPLLTERQCTRQQKDTYQLDSHKELQRVRFQLILAEVSVGSRRQGNFLRVKHRSRKGIPLFRHSLRLGWWFPIIKMFNVYGQNRPYFCLTGLHQPNMDPIAHKCTWAHTPSAWLALGLPSNV